MTFSWAWQDVLSTGVDIALVYIIIYRVLMIIKGTKAVPMLLGLVAIAVLYVVTQGVLLNLPTFNWLLEQFFANILIIVIVVFQADIRRALAAFGQTQIFSTTRSGAADAQAIEEIVKASVSLAGQKIGGLIVIERYADLSAYIADGTRLDARLSKELLYSLFVPERQNPLHDGAAVVRGGRLSTAGVFLPMSVGRNIDRSYGTRHRAALGLSEETDALVVVVSEERGTTSIALDGRLLPDLPPPKLREVLTQHLMPAASAPRTRFRRPRVRRFSASARRDDAAYSSVDGRGGAE